MWIDEVMLYVPHPYCSRKDFSLEIVGTYLANIWTRCCHATGFFLALRMSKVSGQNVFTIFKLDQREPPISSTDPGSVICAS